MLRLRIGLSAAAGLAALWVAAVAADSARANPPAPAKAAVAIENYAFQPDPITIAVGTTVIWTNRDEVTHTVVSSDKLFASPELETNRSFEFTFRKAGTFPYFCTLHPEMKGKVIVK